MNRHLITEGRESPLPEARATAPVRERDVAFVKLYHERWHRLVRLATLLVDRVDIAEELVQDAFAATYRDWDRLDQPAAYVRTAVVNRARSELRRRETRRRRPLETLPSEPTESPPGDPMRDAIARLPERQRTVVVLRFYEDLPLEEIAHLMGNRAGTVKSQLHRALATLRKEIEP